MSELIAIEETIVRCTRCPELRAYTAQIARIGKREHRDCVYWAKPVPGFGGANARLMLVGLAPGAHGSNRTGRPFTGDASGAFLYPALCRAGLASQPHATSRDDGLRLRDTFITAALRCAPPHNKPTPQELRNCFPYLLEEFDALHRLRVMVGLGSIGFAAVLHVLRERGFAPAKLAFAHGARLTATDGRRTITAIASYHPSRQNTNTGKLTVPMFDAIFRRANQILNGDRATAPRARSSARPSSGRARLDSSEKR